MVKELLEDNVRLVEQCKQALTHALRRLNDIPHTYSKTDFKLIEETLNECTQYLFDRKSTTAKPEYFLVDGYWKDDRGKFNNYIVKSTTDQLENEDDSIFFYGLSENDLKRMISEGDELNEDFILTNYRKA